MKVLRTLLIAAGILLILDSLFAARVCNFHLGVILPAFFGLPLLAAGILLPWMDHGFLAFVKWLMVGCYGLAALIFLVCGILMGTAATDADRVEADVLIVLGAAVHGDRVSSVLAYRLETAADYMEQHPETIAIVSGGQGAEETVTEASAMKKYLIERRGIAAERIIIEDASTNTTENFAFSKAKLIEHSDEDAAVAFVTTDFHVFRAGRVAKQAGLDCVGIAAPDRWYLRPNNFMRECVGICVYALQGKL